MVHTGWLLLRTTWQKIFKDADGDKISHKVDSKDYKLTLGHKFGDNADITLKYSKYKSDYERPASGGLLPQLADRNKGEKDIDKLSLAWQQKLTDELSNSMVIYRNTNNLLILVPTGILHRDVTSK